MFRTLGLRNLTVVNTYNHVLGMITREDLLIKQRRETSSSQSRVASGAERSADNPRSSAVLFHMRRSLLSSYEEHV